MTKTDLKKLLGSVMIQQVNGDNLWFGPGVEQQTRIIDEILSNPDSATGSHYVVQLGALSRAVRALGEYELINPDVDATPQPQ